MYLISRLSVSQAIVEAHSYSRRSNTKTLLAMVLSDVRAELCSKLEELLKHARSFPKELLASTKQATLS